MSAVANPQTRVTQVQPRSPLGILRRVTSAPAARRRPKFFYASVAMAIVLGTIVCQIALSVVASSNAFEIDELQVANKTVSRTYDMVKQQVSELSSPQHLAISAETLGMVASATPAYLRLSDGKITGHPTPASSSSRLVYGWAANLVPNAEMPAISDAVNSVTTSVAANSPAGASVTSPSAANTIPAPTTR